MEKVFPENMVPLGKNTFNFSCHPKLTCFMSCCRNVDMFLFPYDIIRLKNCLSIDSETLLNKYVTVVRGNNPYFPSIMLKLVDNDAKDCPFLSDNGCSVYQDRPSSCRTYPLERAVDRNPDGKGPHEYYFLTDHPYCLGHMESQIFTSHEWIRNQRIETFNIMNDLWAEIESVFLTNPWGGEGSGGPKQHVAFMVCYNIDTFRKFSDQNRLQERFRLDKGWKRRMQTDDTELLKFGFQWLKHFLTGSSNLIPR